MDGVMSERNGSAPDVFLRLGVAGEMRAEKRSHESGPKARTGVVVGSLQHADNFRPRGSVVYPLGVAVRSVAVFAAGDNHQRGGHRGE